MDVIATFYKQGGAWMHPILAMSIIGLGIMIERFIFLYFKYNINASAFMAQIQKLVMANNIDRAIKLCSAAPSAALRSAAAFSPAASSALPLPWPW